jgi:hypothetical protein
MDREVFSPKKTLEHDKMNLSLQRKVIVLKSLALPILVQSLTVLPDPPLEIISEIQLEFFNFLWSGKSDKIKRNILIGDFSHGGYKHASYSVILSCSNVLGLLRIVPK